MRKMFCLSITRFDAKGAGTSQFERILPFSIDTAGDVTGYTLLRAALTTDLCRSPAIQAPRQPTTS
jgi:hypothetical protein